MTPEAQRIAIAGACGWKKIESFDAESCLEPIGYPPEGYPLRIILPDYLSDLNAMHEAEKVLTEDQEYKYITLLVGLGWAEAWGFTNAAKAIHATAAQRAEAFLRALHLWKDAS